MDKLLEIKNLHLYFNFYQLVLKALNGVDLVINEREILGLVGETARVSPLLRFRLCS